ncbi:MAG: polyprenol monophosphomannose synthase [Desulfosarcinaceae bacterium]|nr:polyprenol monophosphomannose synthase [Desulfosarcinaceae bacterium]
MRLLIVIPTFNEAQNIADLLHRIQRLLGNTLAPHILVVDDNSPDGTCDIVTDLTHDRYPGRISTLCRPAKMGLASAYVEGFRWGLAHEFDAIAEMDADFSHDPIYLPRMAAALKSRDFVVGSRYTSGGGVKGWRMWRRIVSRGGSLYARAILNLPIHDLTGGYNLWSRHVLETIGLDRICSDGYTFQIELKYRAVQRGFHGIEIPIVFEDRFAGHSKMSRRIVWEAVWRVWHLRLAGRRL